MVTAVFRAVTMAPKGVATLENGLAAIALLGYWRRLAGRAKGLAARGGRQGR